MKSKRYIKVLASACTLIFILLITGCMGKRLLKVTFEGVGFQDPVGAALETRGDQQVVAAYTAESGEANGADLGFVAEVAFDLSIDMAFHAAVLEVKPAAHAEQGWQAHPGNVEGPVLEKQIFYRSHLALYTSMVVRPWKI